MWHTAPLRALVEIEFAGPDPAQKGVPLAPTEHQNGAGIGAIPHGNFPADFPYLDGGHRLTAMATAPPARPDTHLAHGRVLPSARQLELAHSIGGTHHTYCILRSLRSPTGHLPRERERAPGRMIGFRRPSPGAMVTPAGVLPVPGRRRRRSSWTG